MNAEIISLNKCCKLSLSLGAGNMYKCYKQGYKIIFITF